MLILFIVSAVVPLALCAALLYRHFSSGLQVAQERSLDQIARGYGITLLGRLESADETLSLVLNDPATTEERTEANVRKLPWVSGVQREARELTNARQAAALERGRTVLNSGQAPNGSPSIDLVRRLPSGETLRVSIDPRWLWSDVNDFAGDATLRVIDSRGQMLAASDEAPKNAMVRSWELFLGSRFASPSWTVSVLEERPSILGDGREVYLPIFAFIALTILLIAWLSMTAIRRQMQPLELLIRATRRLAERDFGAFRDLHWNDEFGDLAGSFRTMSGKLQKQFAALETFSDVDRLLLDEPELKSILDQILPQLAQILSCECVSVLLFDSEASEPTSVYEYCEHGKTETAASDRVETYPLRHGKDCTGMLRLTYTATADVRPDHGVEAQDFADRLSLIIASLRRSDQLRRQAAFDSLTGLQNRQTLGDRVAEAATAATEHGGVGSFLYIDLDHFKRVNDTSGHAAGDRLLQVVSERLRQSVSAEASVARLGGDEFAVLLPAITTPEQAQDTASRLIAALELPLPIDSRVHHISASIGITLFPADGSTLEDLMRAGDIAMYHAKETGRGNAQFYRPEMQHVVLERVRLEEGLKRAFERRELVLHYQPIVSDGDPRTFAVEALLRWPCDGGLTWIPPSQFIPLAEENGLIVELGHWVLQSARAQLAHWKKTQVGVRYTSVNVSVRQLKEPGYLDNLLHTLHEHGLRGDELQIEITESVFAQDAELAEILGEIATHGVRVALDDFGTGYSSLGYLRTFPVDSVKIDRSFLADVPKDPDASRLVDSIILMCAALGKDVVAEGVENEEQRRYLTDAGCTTLQGYLFARPMDAADIPAFAERLSLNVARGECIPVALAS